MSTRIWDWLTDWLITANSQEGMYSLQVLCMHAMSGHHVPACIMSCYTGCSDVCVVSAMLCAMIMLVCLYVGRSVAITLCSACRLCHGGLYCSIYNTDLHGQVHLLVITWCSFNGLVYRDLWRTPLCKFVHHVWKFQIAQTAQFELPTDLATDLGIMLRGNFTFGGDQD